MSYRIELSPEAQAKLRTIPPGLRQQVAEKMEELAEDPVKRGRETPAPPYVPIGHIFQFHFRHDGPVRYFTVFFLYGDDGETLIVWDIVIDPRFSDTD